MQAISKCGAEQTIDLAAAIRSAQTIIACPALQPMLEFFVKRLGFRVDMIAPADAPSTAVVSGHGIILRFEEASETANLPALRLLCDLSGVPAGVRGELRAPNGMKIELADANPPITIPEPKQEFVITRLRGSEAWRTGRATMQYRDLIPSRLGGRFVASHIRIPEGGAVPDYVHYHRVRFQMIFCKAGWVKVVYEDQGPPFVMHTGDCVLQPPEIRHQVLEASPGLEIIEIGCPAVHETFADHGLPLPTNRFNPERLFSGQRFVRHVGKHAVWSSWKIAGFEARDTGMAAATAGLAEVKVIRSQRQCSGVISHSGELLFLFVLRGTLGVHGDDARCHELHENESCAIPAGIEFRLAAKPATEMLEVALPAD